MVEEAEGSPVAVVMPLEVLHDHQVDSLRVGGVAAGVLHTPVHHHSCQAGREIVIQVWAGLASLYERQTISTACSFAAEQRTDSGAL